MSAQVLRRATSEMWEDVRLGMLGEQTALTTALAGLLGIIDDRVWRITRDGETEVRCTIPVGPDEPCGECQSCWAHNVEQHALAVARAYLGDQP